MAPFVEAYGDDGKVTLTCQCLRICNTVLTRERNYLIMLDNIFSIATYKIIY